MYHVGIDIHSKQSSLCVINRNGECIKRATVRGGTREVCQALAEFEGDLHIAFEASLGYGRWFEALSKIAKRVTVAHPGQLRLIFRSKKKNDRNDAETLARLAAVDALPAVHVPQLDVRHWRKLITSRQKAVSARTRIKNGIRALFREEGIATPRTLWIGKGRAWLNAYRFDDEMQQLDLDEFLLSLAEAEARVDRITARLDQIARAHPGVALLQTIPGIGPRTAEAVVAWIDKPHRFVKNNRIGAYFGLVPSQDASADRNRLGRITCDGPSAVRHLLVEASWQAIRRSPAVRARFERIMRDDPLRKKKALVATAHHLARVMLAMLKSGEVWRDEMGDDLQPAKRARSSRRRSSRKQIARRASKRTNDQAQTETSAEDSTQRSTKQTATRSTKQTATRSTQQPATRSTQQPATRSTQQPAMRSTQQPAMRSTKQPATRSTKQPATRSTTRPTKRPATRPKSPKENHQNKQTRV